MLAQLQRFLVLFLLASACAWLAVLHALGHPILAALGAVLIIVSHALVLGVEFVMLRFTRHGSTVRPPGTLELVRAWWHEALLVPVVFFWRQPFRSKSVADQVHPGADADFGVVLVHGYVCNRGLWNPWMVALRARGIPYVAVTLEPVFGSIDGYTGAIEQAVRAIESATAHPVVLVGHSMGGLAIRAWLCEYAALSRVRRIVTIGTPHQGAWLARWSRTTNGTQMRLHSPWLRELSKREQPHTSAAFTCLYSDCDNVVAPRHSATMPGAVNLCIPGAAHLALAFHPAARQQAFQWLAAQPRITLQELPGRDGPRPDPPQRH
jgi:pimeloyl-ACP methyl ester carboxylesterase